MMRRLWILCLVTVTGCESSVESQREQDLWQELGIRNYQYQYMISCFCSFTSPNPALITVHDGVVTRVEPVEGGAPLESGVSAWPTVDSLFALIDRFGKGNSDVLEVEYDGTYHYPKSIHLDPVERVVDDEITYRVERFVPLSDGH